METDAHVEVKRSVRGVTVRRLRFISVIEKMAFPKDTGQMFNHRPTRWRLADVVQ